MNTLLKSDAGDSQMKRGMVQQMQRELPRCCLNLADSAESAIGDITQKVPGTFRRYSGDTIHNSGYSGYSGDTIHNSGIPVTQYTILGGTVVSGPVAKTQQRQPDEAQGI